MVCHRAATNIAHGGMWFKVADKFRKFVHQSRETRMSDRAWTRTDALNRMLAELYEMTVASDEKQHQSVMLSRKSAANSRSHTPESSGLSGVYVISVAAKLAEMHPKRAKIHELFLHRSASYGSPRPPKHGFLWGISAQFSLLSTKILITRPYSSKLLLWQLLDDVHPTGSALIFWELSLVRSWFRRIRWSGPSNMRLRNTNCAAILCGTQNHCLAQMLSVCQGFCALTSLHTHESSRSTPDLLLPLSHSPVSHDSTFVRIDFYPVDSSDDPLDLRFLHILYACKLL